MTCVGITDIDLPGERTGQNGMSGRKITCNNVTFNTDGGVAPSGAKELFFNNCAFNWGAEVDKAVEYIEFNNCTSRSGMVFQSTSINEVRIDGCKMSISGTPKRMTILNSNLVSYGCNSGGYGASDWVHIENTDVENGFGANISGSYYELKNMTFSNGTFRLLKGLGHFMTLGIPGSMMFFSSGLDNWGNPFMVRNVWEDDDYWYMDTTLQNFPVYSSPGYAPDIGQPVKLISHPCKSITVRNCTGGSDPYKYHTFDFRGCDLTRMQHCACGARALRVCS